MFHFDIQGLEIKITELDEKMMAPDFWDDQALAQTTLKESKSMKYILIRDDDLNFFTPFEELKTVYGFMFEQGIPVNFSTIPAVNGAAKTLSNDKKKEVFEPFLPDAIAGTKGSFYLSDNTNLLSSLKLILGS